MSQQEYRGDPEEVLDGIGEYLDEVDDEAVESYSLAFRRYFSEIIEGFENLGVWEETDKVDDFRKSRFPSGYLYEKVPDPDSNQTMFSKALKGLYGLSQGLGESYIDRDGSTWDASDTCIEDLYDLQEEVDEMLTAAEEDELIQDIIEGLERDRGSMLRPQRAEKVTLEDVAEEFEQEAGYSLSKAAIETRIQRIPDLPDNLGIRKVER